MKRMLFGMTAALLVVAANAGPPAVSPKPTQNVNVVNAPLAVEVPERVIPWDVFANGGMQTMGCNADFGSPDTVTCDSPVVVTVNEALTIRGVMFLPRSLDTALSDAAKAGSCDATYWLSADGERYVRFLAFSWTPATISSQFVSLPMPVQFLAGANVHQRLVIQKRGGADPSIACGLFVKGWAIRQ
jgi:hypothetical protein